MQISKEIIDMIYALQKIIKCIAKNIKSGCL